MARAFCRFLFRAIRRGSFFFCAVLLFAESPRSAVVAAALWDRKGLMIENSSFLYRQDDDDTPYV